MLCFADVSEGLIRGCESQHPARGSRFLRFCDLFDYAGRVERI